MRGGAGGRPRGSLVRFERSRELVHRAVRFRSPFSLLGLANGCKRAACHGAAASSATAVVVVRAPTSPNHTMRERASCERPIATPLSCKRPA